MQARIYRLLGAVLVALALGSVSAQASYLLTKNALGAMRNYVSHRFKAEGGSYTLGRCRRASAVTVWCPIRWSFPDESVVHDRVVATQDNRCVMVRESLLAGSKCIRG